MPDPVLLDITSFAYDTTRCKSPVLSLPLPQEFFGFIGQIIVLFSRLENQIIEIIQAANNFPGHSSQKIERNFSGITQQLIKVANDIFFDMPSTHAYVLAIASEATVLQIDRNLIAHGRIVTTNSTGFVGMTVTSTNPKQNLTKVYSVVDLENLFYEVSHLCGRLRGIEMSHTSFDLLQGRIAENELLRLRQFCQDHHPNAPLPDGT